MAFQNVCIATIMYVTSLIQTGSTCSCVHLNVPTLTPETHGEVLVNSSFANVSVHQMSICASRCLRQLKCKSFNYNIDTKTCSLNNQTRATAADKFIATGNKSALYFDIREWDQDLLGGCANHACSEEDICSPGYFGPDKDTYICLGTYSADVTAPLSTYSPCTYSTSCADCVPVRQLGPRKFSPVGCYTSGSTNALPTYVDSFRSNIDWYNITATIIKCAEAAQAYPLFGIEFYGECYAGSDATARFDNGLIDVSKCDLKCPVGVGGSDVMMVYRWL